MITRPITTSGGKGRITKDGEETCYTGVCEKCGAKYERLQHFDFCPSCGSGYNHDIIYTMVGSNGVI